MNLGLFLMIVVAIGYVLGVKMFYNSLQRRQKRIDFEESRKNATFEKETKIGIAEALARVKFPNSMVIGGSSNNGAVNPFDAVGLQSLYELSEKMANKK